MLVRPTSLLVGCSEDSPPRDLLVMATRAYASSFSVGSYRDRRICILFLACIQAWFTRRVRVVLKLVSYVVHLKLPLCMIGRGGGGGRRRVLQEQGTGAVY